MCMHPGRTESHVGMHPGGQPLFWEGASESKGQVGMGAAGRRRGGDRLWKPPQEVLQGLAPLCGCCSEQVPVSVLLPLGACNTLWSCHLMGGSKPKSSPQLCVRPRPLR